MKKRMLTALSALLILPVLFTSAFAAGITYTVVPGDSLWKIAVKY